MVGRRKSFNTCSYPLHTTFTSSFPALAAFTVACCSVQAIYQTVHWLILNAVAKSVLQELILLPVPLGDRAFLCSVSEHEFV